MVHQAICSDVVGHFAVQCKGGLHLLMQCTLSTSAKSYFIRWDYLNLSGGRQPFCDFTLYRLSDIAPYSATGPPFQCLGLQDSQFPGLARSGSVPRQGSNPGPLGFSPRALPLHHFNSLMVLCFSILNLKLLFIVHVSRLTVSYRILLIGYRMVKTIV